MKRVSLVLFLVCAFLLVAGETAFAEEPLYTQNSQCLECHGADLGGPATKKVDFGVGPVDKSTACAKCHWIAPHPVHHVTSQCAGCHRPWPFRLDFFTSQVSAPEGYFTSLTSPGADATRLHSIHANGSWVQVIADKPGCVSCHAPAACDACHESAIQHGDHTFDAVDGTYSSVPETYSAAYGTSNPALDTRATVTSTCGAAACHARAESKIPRTSTIYDQANRTSWVFSAGWSTVSKSDTYGGSLALANTAGSTAVATVSGPGLIRLYGTRRPNTGILNVSIDGGPALPIDTFNGSPVYTDLLTEWNLGDLSAGTHQVVITVTGEKNPLSSGVNMFLAAVRGLNAGGAAMRFTTVGGS
ncbi:hypothetical protein EG829_17465 [bacterium]|nr:hypothetical protein [bacterium]